MDDNRLNLWDDFWVWLPEEHRNDWGPWWDCWKAALAAERH